MTKLRFLLPLFSLTLAATAQQPRGAHEALENITSQTASHTAFTFDRDMLQTAEGIIDDGSPEARRTMNALNSITVESFRYHQPAFYIPENIAALEQAYHRAGWKHLINQNAPPRESASPNKPITDLWLHFRGAEIDDVTVLVRGQKNMNLIEVSGAMRPLDLVHLSGHFGIPKVDPDAVMVPAPPGR